MCQCVSSIYAKAAQTREFIKIEGKWCGLKQFISHQHKKHSQLKGKYKIENLKNQATLIFLCIIQHTKQLWQS
jgi:hypothetical protein